MNNLRAALVLTLDDKLSAGLNRLKENLEQLRQVGRGLSLGKLGEAVGPLQRLRSEVHGLTGDLRGVAAMADRAWARMKQMAAAPLASARQAFSKQGKIGAFAGAMEGYSLAAPIHTYADFQDLALRAAITQGLSGAAAQREAGNLMQFFREDARRTGQSSTSVADAYLDLIQTGMSPKLAKELLPIHSRAATAYGIAPEALGHAVFALADTLKIGEREMGGALSAMALAAQKGRFKIEDFSRFLPGIAGNAAKLGMTGRANANILFAALETVMRNSSEPSTGATNFTDFMNYITSPMAARSFALESRGMAPQTRHLLDQYHITGIDMPALLANARTKGMNPLEAVLGALQSKVNGLPPDVVAQVLGAFFHNQQARDAAVALLLHSGEYQGLKQQLGGASAGKLDTDYQTRMGGGAVQTKQFSEAISELGQTLGRGFTPILVVVNRGLQGLLDLLDRLDAKAPGVTDAVSLVVGSMLALGAVSSAIGFIWPALSTGFQLFGAVLRLAAVPLRWLATGVMFVVDALATLAGVSAGVVVAIIAAAAAIGAAAYDVIANWQRFRDFFAEMGAGIVDIVSGLADIVAGVLTLDLAGGIVRGFTLLGQGLVEFFSGLWGTIRQLFVDFGGWVDSWTGGAMTAAVEAVKGAWSGLTQWFGDLWASIRKPFDDFVNYIVNSPVGHLLHLSSAPQLQAPGAKPGEGGDAAPTSGPDLSGGSYLMPPITGHITVGVDPNNGQIKVTKTESGTTGMSLLSNVGPALAWP